MNNYRPRKGGAMNQIDVNVGLGRQATGEEVARAAMMAVKAIIMAGMAVAPAARAIMMALWRVICLVVIALAGAARAIWMYGPDMAARAAKMALVAYYNAKGLGRAAHMVTRAAKRVSIRMRKALWAAGDGAKIALSPVAGAAVVIALLMARLIGGCGAMAAEGWRMRKEIIQEARAA